MGREIKRVALDFDYPLGMVWKGYWNPYYGLECKACHGSGLSLAYKQLSDDWYDKGWCYQLTQDEVQALVDKNRLMDFTHIPRNEEQREIVRKKVEAGGNSWLPEPNGYIPTADEVNHWAKTTFIGHDAINRMICVEARAKRLGITETTCKYCKGNGVLWPDDKYADLHNDFEWVDPPSGEGFQLWENTSEGSPLSPVFENPEDLAKWLADNKASSFGSHTESYETWLKFIMGSGWAPSMVVTDGQLMSGVEGLSDL